MLKIETQNPDQARAIHSERMAEAKKSLTFLTEQDHAEELNWRFLEIKKRFIKSQTEVLSEKVHVERQLVLFGRFRFPYQPLLLD